MTFNDYITEPRILRQLVRMRIAEAGKRHSAQRLWSISPMAPHPMDAVEPVFRDLFPSRRQWKRCRLRQRQRQILSGESNMRINLERLVRDDVARNPVSDAPWRIALAGRMDAIRRLANDPEPVFDAPVTYRIRKTGGGFRNLSAFMDPSQRCLLAMLYRFMNLRFDAALRECVYAFRSDPGRNRTRAIHDLENYRQDHGARGLFVAECDLEDFFPRIPHASVRSALDRARPPLDPQTRRWVEAYLRAGEAEPAVGIPQGGVLSPLLANLVLAPVDEAVLRVSADPPVFYARFCDDILIAHPDPKICRDALTRYVEAVQAIGLSVHPPRDSAAYDAAYYENKSKRPFLWGEPAETPSAIPWVGFLGYQLRHNGEIRVRKDSVRKQLDRQRNLVEEIRGLVNRTPPGHLRQSGQKILDRTAQHMIATSVGRIQTLAIDAPTTQPCWTDAFERVTANGSTRFHYRMLDRERERHLRRLKRLLIRKKLLPTSTANPKDQDKTPPMAQPASHAEQPERMPRYLGSPYSYHGSLFRKTESHAIPFNRYDV